MYKKFIGLTALLCTAVFLFTACGNTVSQNTSSKKDGKVNVVVSFNAMREFAQAVGKDKVNIVTMIPDGTEPHDFEPKPSDIKSLSNAKIFIYNGFGMESWAEEVIKSSGNNSLVAVQASDGSTPIENKDENERKENGKYDPHLWLSLKGAQSEAKNIKDALVKVDPSNKSYYEKNFNDFSKELDTLYNEYDGKFKAVKNKGFVTGHAAFAYFCRDFGLKQESVEDVFAEGEPSTKKLTELIDYCKKNNIKTVFVEDMVSPKVSNTLASEVGAKVEQIHTIESREKDKDYIECMKENLDMIYSSLK